MSEDVEKIVKREVDAARAILREDRILKSHTELHARFDKHFPAESQGGNPDGSPNDPGKPPAPAPKDTTADPPEEKRKGGIWWGVPDE